MSLLSNGKVIMARALVDKILLLETPKAVGTKTELGQIHSFQLVTEPFHNVCRQSGVTKLFATSKQGLIYLFPDFSPLT